MPTYGSRLAVEQLLRATVTAAFSADQEARIDALLTVVSAIIEQETGRVFGTGQTSETVVVTPSRWSGAMRSIWPLDPSPDALGLGFTDLLVLPKGVRTIQGVTVGGTWDGAAYTGGDALPATAYVPVYRLRTGEYLALRTADGSYWPMPVAIAGTWEDTDADAAVPDEITYLANYLAAEQFKKEMASPNGAIGPDGSVIPLRNTFKDPYVMKILDKWRITNEALVL